MATVSRTRIVLWVALAAYSAALAVALLAPTSTTQSEMAGWLRDLAVDLGISPYRATQAHAEFLGNVLILVPISALGSLAWRGTTWRGWTAYAFVLACAVELVQGLLLTGRTPSSVDIVANTLGGLLGAVVVGVAGLVVRSVSAPRRHPSAGHRKQRAGLG